MNQKNSRDNNNYPFIIKHKLPFLFIFASFCFISIINIPLLTTLWQHSFDDGTYSHAFIIPLISLYLYYKLNDVQKLQFRTQPNFYLLVFLFCCAVLFFITTTAQISIGYWVTFLLLLITTVLALFKFNFYIIFPAAYFIFLIPFWGSLVDILQAMSVASVSFMMSFTGIPTFVEAQYVSIPAGTFEIADGCSGLRYLIVSLSISSLYIFLFINNSKRAGLFFLAAILGGLITNWLRITILVLIGHQTDMTHSLMHDHNSFGWYVYIPFMFLLFMLGNKLKDHDLLDPIDVKETPSSQSSSPNVTTLASLTFILLASSIFVRNLLNNEVINEHNQFMPSAMYPKIYNYSGIQNIIEATLPINTSYSVYTYNSEELDSKPTYFENNYLLKGWNIERDISTTEWRTFVGNNKGEKSIIAYSFQLGSFKTASSKLYKIQRLKSVFYNNDAPKLHWFNTPCKSNCAEEAIKVQSFITSK